MKPETYLETIYLDDLTVEVHECSDRRDRDSNMVVVRTRVANVWASVRTSKLMLKDKESLRIWAARELKSALKRAVWEAFATANNIKP